MAIDYKDAGVDVEAGYEAVKLMKEYVKKTYDKNVLGDLGSFGGFYSLDDKEDGDVLVAGTDGVGTKLKYAFVANKHDTVGIDCVAMCVNDIVCQGAKPLFFLDYLAQGKVSPEKVADIVKGISSGCVDSGCALIGGETAEMPGFYPEGEYDMAGFAVGIAKKNKIINGNSIVAGDVLIGITSSGIHSNGYSLVRKLFGEDMSVLDVYSDELGAKPIDVLLTPTKLYVKLVLDLIEKFTIKGIAHITGGGFIENIPRIFPKGIGCKVDINSYDVPKVFKYMQKVSGISNEKIYNTFNMGIGLVLAVDKSIAGDVVNYLNKTEKQAYIIGETVVGSGVSL